MPVLVKFRRDGHATLGASFICQGPATHSVQQPALRHAAPQ